MLRVCKASAVVGSFLIIGATVATSASAYALVQYVDSTWNGSYAGRMGAILAVQCAAAGTMTVHALLAFAVAGDMQEHSEGSIRLEE
ncbi:unnamed protein product [Aureobasidium vineae]|uniref:Uncharacterized protein n=1 Tax=Aureobasidium vineae TaxID=2773715 RepID=A0A9N8K2Z7_9PEZI|nr:unnamed protein product [Aureobasidium vineae]